MTADEVRVRLTKLLSENFEIEPQKVTPDATFRGTLGLDSLDVVDLVFFIQEEFGFKDKLDSYRDLHTVEKVCAYIATRADASKAG
jgi:acyl carrier protein